MMGDIYAEVDELMESAYRLSVYSGKLSPHTSTPVIALLREYKFTVIIEQVMQMPELC
jgi:hypothetical protein